MEEGEITNETRYNPDFDLGVRSEKRAPKASASIEAGLAAGRLYLEKVMSETRAKKSLHKDHGLVNESILREELVKRDWLVLPTDKNLGCAIVRRDWYIEHACTLLSDKESYELLTTDRALMRLRLIKDKIVALKNHYTIEGFKNSQLREWLISNIDQEDPFKGLPHFYVIPKIHKNPWKARPIVPCHSSIQGPAALVLDKLLQPLLQDRNHVLTSSKQLAKELDSLHLSPGKKYWIVTGDVTAFYPNIDVSVAKDICINYLKEGWKDIAMHKGMAFLELLWNVAMGDLIMRFQDKLYLQKKGLAMGVACSPTIANLYGAFCEELVYPQLYNVLYYRRYIDDLIFIVEADSFQEALMYVKPMRIYSCEIVYSEESIRTVFLDMELFVDPERCRIQYRPYRKPQNSFERIPWASHHPTDVKRGTFIGEMSRLAALSSKYSYYEEALGILKDVYLSRGYPASLVRTWLVHNKLERWATRHGDRHREHEHVHVIKSVFNPVWGYVDAHVLQTTIKEAYVRHEVEHNWKKEVSALVQTKLDSYFQVAPRDWHKRVLVERPYGEDRPGQPLTLKQGNTLAPPVDFLPSPKGKEKMKPATRHHRLYGTEGSALGGWVRKTSRSPDSSESEGEGINPSKSDPLGAASDVGKPSSDAASVEQEESEVKSSPSDPQEASQVDPILALLDRRLVVSRKRTNVLGDLVNSWRRVVLAYTPSHSIWSASDTYMMQWSKGIDSADVSSDGFDLSD